MMARPPSPSFYGHALQQGDWHSPLKAEGLPRGRTVPAAPPAGERLLSVLHIYKDYYPPVLGGIEKHISMSVRALSRLCRVRVLVANRSPRTEHAIIDGIPVTKVADLGRFLSAPVAPGFPRWLKKLDSDILHFHLPNPTAEISALLSRPTGRIVVTYHSDIVRQKLTGRLYGPVQEAFLRRADVILATSEHYLQSSRVLAAFRERCRVVPLGVDTRPFERNEELLRRAEEIRAAHPGPRVFFLGVLRYYKGLSFLVRAMKNTPGYLYLAGDGPEGPALRRLAEKEGLSRRVCFLGTLPDREAVAWLHAIDVFCLPAHLRSEAFGLCQVEAHLAGKPVVSTRLETGVPFVNQDGVTGIVVPPGSPEHLAEALTRLLEDEDLRLRMGAQARDRAVREFSLDAMIDRVWSVYLEVIGRRGG
jgi:rhamnosyl/mannosyltransferase